MAEPFRRLTATIGTEGGEVIIEGCPFAWHSGPTCSPMHNCIDGVVRSNGLRVTWTAQTPLGDPRCSFCIQPLQMISDERDLLLVLNERLVRGEIAFEEYERIRHKLDR